MFHYSDRKLLNQQASLSEEDRNKLIQIQMEHLARLNNSLSLNKIHQMQTLQDKLVRRKMSLMERLENKRLKASFRFFQFISNINDEVNDFSISETYS